MNSWAAVTLLSLVLAGCSSSGGFYDPADVEPVYKIRNSPLPVPDPKWNPRRKSAAQTAPARTARKAPAPDRTAAGSANVNGATHTVKRGETLYAISRKYSVPLRSWITVNKLRSPYALAVGQKLSIPLAWTHTVKRGETGYSISRKYQVTVSALMRTNGIKPPYRLAVGQKLKLPGGAGRASTQTADAAAIRVTASVGRTAKAAPRQGRTVAMPTPPPRSNKGFTWPVSGKLASRFGPREGGIHNDGINILAARGTPVKVAEAGVVVYASNALEGYGNLLLVKHAGGWITAYAHAERILVRPGQKVNRGEVVARVGATGGVASPQLHFEIRKGRQALDPLRYLSS
jgi:murein DD-endopeptidase MepM/ murein hydrolase activator NlpD